MTATDSLVQSSSTLLEQLIATRYSAYAYSYPHKTAYRKLESPIHLSEVWKNENLSSLFLYFHVPFCEMRCGFCNLFTTAHPADEQEKLYMQALERQASSVRSCLPGAQIATVAVGGGTPTYLSVESLVKLFEIAERSFGVDPRKVPIGIETSPGTASKEKLDLLSKLGVHRVSIGVQSFVETELSSVGRSKDLAELETALQNIKQRQFPIFNIDLIYGLPSQTAESWRYSLQRCLEFQPEEVFIYPLYVRPLTGLGKTGSHWHDHRDELYRIACDFLQAHNYEQISMRMFRKSSATTCNSTKYCCQTDGMIGLGAGARSYTKRLHYSGAYAVQRQEIKSIIDGYIATSNEAFQQAVYGIVLSESERKRRFIIQSLLQREGLSLVDYREEFDSNPISDVPILHQLIDCGLAESAPGRIGLSAAGIELSDSISYALYSDEVKSLMTSYEAK